jgi:hypothetical protein
MPNIDKTIALIPQMDDVRLMALYKNCIRDQPNDELRRDADVILDAVIDHWSRQVIAARLGIWSPDRPERGLLKWLGYTVGHEGESASVRRRILGRVMSGSLPMVGSPAYIDEWGKPRTAKRYSKLRRTLDALRESNLEKPGFELACAHWENDLAYVDATWGDLVAR